VKIPLLNMINLAAEHAAQQVGKGGTVGILASPALRQTGVLDRALEAQGISVIWPERDAAMLVAIRQIKAEGPVPQARDALMQASLELSAAGSQMQFIACSEFSLIADNVADGAQSVDTVDLLAQAIVDASNAD
jgi:aspartate racemase